eukprot:31023-Pelagococcus_subviridis.AAC.8
MDATRGRARPIDGDDDRARRTSGSSSGSAMFGERACVSVCASSASARARVPSIAARLHRSGLSSKALHCSARSSSGSTPRFSPVSWFQKLTLSAFQRSDEIEDKIRERSADSHERM